MSDFSVRFNAHPRIVRVPLDNGQAVLVVDDVLDHPQRLVQLASAVNDEFVQVPGNAFPGRQIRMDDDFSAKLDAFFRLHIRGHLNGRRSLQMTARLSRVTLPEQELDARQRICHRDTAGVAPGTTVFASVLYLFQDPGLGGTVFFSPVGNAEQTETLVHDASDLSQQAFEQKYDWRPGYMTRSNGHFKVIGRIPARWNRIIFYDGGIFHSSDITSPDKLDLPGDLGRLTVNGFFTCTLKAT